MDGTQPLPPSSGVGVQRRDGDGATCGLLVQYDRGGKSVSCESGPDPEVGVAIVDGRSRPLGQCRRLRGGSGDCRMFVIAEVSAMSVSSA